MKKVQRRKKFNDTGVCVPTRHFMADVSNKLAKAWDFVEQGEYFIINRPRQYGKTTMFYLLTQRMEEDDNYLPLKMSFAGIGDVVFETEASFVEAFLDTLVSRTRRKGKEDLANFLKKEMKSAATFKEMGRAISKFTALAEQQVVLLIDEVDKSSNNQLFISFLALLRDKYLNQIEGEDTTFHSVILAGLHDIKTIKLKIRPDAQQKYNSPWNIAADFNIEMGFFPHEIAPMLEDYKATKGVKMDSQAIADKLYYYTHGYPFLVSKLCKIIDEDFTTERTSSEWIEQDITDAFKILIQQNNTNLDSLVKSLENNPDLYNLVYRILVENDSVLFNPHNPTIHWGILHGIFRRKSGDLHIHNRVYQEVIYNYMVSKAIEKQAFITRYAPFGKRYLLPSNRLDLENVLKGFQSFMKVEFSEKDRSFLERHGRLVFLAYLKPIINGGGYDFKEPQISEEKRLDIVVTFYQHRYVIELKRWMGEQAHEDGLEQLADYLEIQGLDKGYLLIFNTNKIKKFWTAEWIDYRDKRIFAIWV